MLALVKRVQSLLPSWNIMAGLGQEETTVDTEVTLLDFLTGCGGSFRRVAACVDSP